MIQAAYWLAYCSALSFYACSILFFYSYAAFHISSACLKALSFTLFVMFILFILWRRKLALIMSNK